MNEIPDIPIQFPPSSASGRQTGSLFWARPNRRTAPDVADPELYQACQGFEAHFAKYLFSQMRGETRIMEGDSHAAEMYQGMFDEVIGEHVAANGGLGIADMMYRQIMETRGISPNAMLGPGNMDPTMNPRLDEFRDVIESAARENSLDPSLLRAVIQRESGANPLHSSQRGRQGLMAISEEMMREENVGNAFDPEENVNAGAAYLRRQYERFGTIPLALAAFHASPEAVERHNGLPPYTETRLFVNKVLDFYGAFKSALGDENDEW